MYAWGGGLNTFEKAREFIYRNARPIDLSRWQYHFENGSKKAVLDILSCYQNEDGGFGHALEADSWNPNSSPIQTWCAVELLREINFTDSAHPIIKGILKYLESENGFVRNKWISEIESNNYFPHAFWWEWKPDSEYDYNPTATLAGFILKFADKKSPLFYKACEIAKESANSLLYRDRVDDGHLLLCYIRLYQCCIETNTITLFDFDEYSKKLMKFVSKAICNADIDWSCDGVVFEYINAYAHDLQSISLSRDKINYIVNYLKNNQQEDGSWSISWNWSGYAEEWAISKNWWKSYGIIANMLFLKRYQSCSLD